jgi:hypothetical protein
MIAKRHLEVSTDKQVKFQYCSKVLVALPSCVNAVSLKASQSNLSMAQRLTLQLHKLYRLFSMQLWQLRSYSSSSFSVRALGTCSLESGV